MKTLVFLSFACLSIVNLSAYNYNNNSGYNQLSEYEARSLQNQERALRNQEQANSQLRSSQDQVRAIQNSATTRVGRI